MKQYLIAGLCLSLAASCIAGELISTKKLSHYKQYLITGTYNRDKWRTNAEKPLSRYDTFLRAFQEFEKNNGHIIVELGTTRSFVTEHIAGCLSTNPKYWRPDQPQYWDWGAGCFTRVAIECLAHLTPHMFTIDVSPNAMSICRYITQEYADLLTYCIMTSVEFLNECSEQIDLLYLDTGDPPLEKAAQLQLREAKIIIERDLISPGGLILLDDVRNTPPTAEKPMYGKAMYSLPYFLEYGFEIIEDGYQVLLRKK